MHTHNAQRQASARLYPGIPDPLTPVANLHSTTVRLGTECQGRFTNNGLSVTSV
jgi:hypothetical protein